MAYTPLEAAQVIMQALCRNVSCWKNGHWESLGDKADTEECNNHCVFVSPCIHFHVLQCNFTWSSWSGGWRSGFWGSSADFSPFRNHWKSMEKSSFEGPHLPNFSVIIACKVRILQEASGWKPSTPQNLVAFRHSAAVHQTRSQRGAT